MSADVAVTGYHIKLQQLRAEIHHARVAQYIIIALVAPLFLRLPVWCATLPVIAATARLYGTNRDHWTRLIRLRSFYERATTRVEGRWHGSGFAGEESGKPNHVYDADLQIPGTGSLFELTCTARTGIGAVLAAGAPVRAASLRLTALQVFASLSIADSILEGKSKFSAEVERLRLTLECARHSPVLFLIDEILSGTNTRDRRIADESIVRALVEHGATGALSTHDRWLQRTHGIAVRRSSGSGL